MKLIYAPAVVTVCLLVTCSFEDPATSATENNSTPSEAGDRPPLPSTGTWTPTSPGDRPYQCGEEAVGLPANPVWLVTAESLRVRTEPRLDAPPVATLERNTPVREVGRSKNLVEINNRIAPWVRIESRWGRRGWAFGGYLSLYDPLNSTALGRLAEAGKKSRPGLALKLYEQILRNKKDTNRDDMSSCKIMAHYEVARLRCELTPRPTRYTATVDELFQKVRRGFESGQTAGLVDWTACGFTIGFCSSGIIRSYPVRTALRRLRSYAAPIKSFKKFDVNNDGTRFRIELERTGKPDEFALYFRRSKMGWQWTGYCAGDRELFRGLKPAF